MYNINSFQLMLIQIRKRPGLYLASKSLTSLYNFWQGYAERDFMEIWEKKTGKNYFENYEEASRTNVTKLYDERDSYFMDGFDEFVHRYYNVNVGALNGITLIIRENNSEEEAFDKFFELFDEFLKQKDDATFE